MVLTHTPSAADLLTRYRRARSVTEALCGPLEAEDAQLQPMTDVSPPKWHLAHTSWFFEEFVAIPALGVSGYRPFHPAFRYLFNSYYDGVGPRHPREARGLLSRPTLREVLRYRKHVDEAVEAALDAASRSGRPEVLDAAWLGIHHEEQHQELLVTDIKYILWSNPLRPAYRPRRGARGSENTPASMASARYRDYPGGRTEIGAHSRASFSFDNERPRHSVWLGPFRLASRKVTNGEFVEFVEAGGYQESCHWLADGWTTVMREAWEAPLYWERSETWREFTLEGMQALELDSPVCHLSFYEADAYARWRGARLPTEAEWEHAAQVYDDRAPGPNWLEDPRTSPLRPLSAGERGALPPFGDVWEWTASPYAPYPGFCALEGVLGEYNGKFMCNQMVLRGGSCATPSGHFRATYRNFFPPAARWQFSGVRLASQEVK